jgi:ABC-type nitrate/sulfonate/bicarbonate transport system substrate-binding protein
MKALAHSFLVRVLVAAVAAAITGEAIAQSVTIRIGRGAAGEEQLWLLKAKPSLARNYGSKYTVDMTYFPSADKRFQAMEAGALDITTSNAHTALYAAAANIPIKIIASISRESAKGAHTRFVVKSESEIKSIKDLKGRTIGVVGLRSATHFWASTALRKVGLDPDKDVTFVPIQFPVQGAALRSGKIDMGALVQPFAMMEEKKGGIRTIFTSKDAVPFDEELIVLVARSEFLEKHAEAVRAFLADLTSVTAYYLANLKDSRGALIEAQMIRIPPEIYAEMPDFYREPSLRVDIDALKKAQDLHMTAGMQEKRADVDSVVNMDFLPK